MTKLSSEEKAVEDDFNRALQLRDKGRFLDAIELLTSVTSKLSEHSARLLPHSHVQIANMYAKLGDNANREKHARMAVNASPKWDLASLHLFFALDALGRSGEAMREMVRLLTLVDSDEYRQMLSKGFGADLPPDEQELAARARALLSEHQRGRSKE